MNDKDLAGMILEPMFRSLEDPAEAQLNLLFRLKDLYRRTEYGKERSVKDVYSVEDFRRLFPKVEYSGLKRYIEEVKRGRYGALLPEPPVCWVMTRGSTGRAKVLPVTRMHLEDILICGARALVNYALRNGDMRVLEGKILNLNFPSRVSFLDYMGNQVPYGYSSGTYARLLPELGRVRLVPLQDEVDALGSGIEVADWERRFELVYKRAFDEDVTAVMGVAPVILSFAVFVKKRFGKLPRDVWRVRALFCTSVRKIHYRYAPVLRRYFGQVPVVEIYSATEGVFGQQMDSYPYILPNYDRYLFEVETGRGVKMLYELRRGEWGRLIISSCMLPRYDIGDMVEAMGKNYFRVFGRATGLHILEHRLYRLFFGWLL
ncbi:MAG: GH3 auxin-responsive promoter family protein [Nitrososphaerota archaeon]|nr:GH3 auxin-responsive promoter family protein [Candidatus Bathyarchaeota archaeon]MDW8048891.1 GH3 auxin-responsive promoter family protein [Nitrososphaerota archaeon]